MRLREGSTVDPPIIRPETEMPEKLPPPRVAVGRKGACCAGQDIHDARNVADRIGIPHYVLDYER